MAGAEEVKGRMMGDEVGEERGDPQLVLTFSLREESVGILSGTVTYLTEVLEVTLMLKKNSSLQWARLEAGC